MFPPLLVRINLKPHTMSGETLDEFTAFFLLFISLLPFHLLKKVYPHCPSFWSIHVLLILASEEGISYFLSLTLLPQGVSTVVFLWISRSWVELLPFQRHTSPLSVTETPSQLFLSFHLILLSSDHLLHSEMVLFIFYILNS